MTILLSDPRVAGVAAELTVDLGAVAANTRTLIGRTRAQLMAVVKAGGFGHGAVAVARTALAAGATWLGVTSIAEALPLRAAGLTAPVLSWLNPVDLDVATAVRHGIDLAVPSLAHLDTIVRDAPATARIHLHLDTGMARDGADPAEWDALCAAARRAEESGRVAVIGMMGHLACADGPADRAGREVFRRGLTTATARGLRPAVRHLAATSATLHDPDSHFDLVRAGAGLVGIDPSGRTRLRGALTLTAPVVTVRRVAAGTPVGYGHTWRAPRATTLATIGIGYADGLPRIAGPAAHVQLHGVRRAIAGRISMDQVVVDAGDLPVAPGDPVVVLGPAGPTVADWARWAGTIPHEIVTGFGPRLRRRVVEEIPW
jgi:alanine racemase